MRTVDNTNKKRRGYGLSVSEKRSRRRLNRNNRTNNKSNKLVPVSVPVQVQVNIQSKSSRETHTNKPFSSKSKRHREERERDPFEVPSDHEDDNDNEDEDPENDEDCFEMMIPKKQEEVQPTRMNRTRGVSSRSRLLRKRKRIVIDIDSDSDSEESNHNEIEIEIENENREDREDSTRTNHHGDNNDYIDIEEPPVPLTQPFTQREQSTGTGRDRIDTLLLAPGRTTRTRSTISKRRGHVRSDCSFAEVEIDEIVSSDDADSSSSSPAAVLDNARAQLSQRRSSSTRSQSRNTMDNDMDGSSTDDSSVDIQLIGRRQAQNTIATRPRTTRTRTNSQNRTSMDTRRIQDSIQSDVDASSKDVPMSMSADISSSAGGDNDGHDDDDDDSSFEYIASQNKSRKNRATTVRDPKHLDRSKSRTRTGIKKQIITCEDDQSDTTNVNDNGNDNGNAAARIRTRSRAKSMNESNPNTGTSQEEPSSSPNPTDTCSTSTCTNPKIANKIKALSDLSNKVSSLSPSSSKQALDKLVQRIVNQYNELSRFQESLNGDADVDGSRQQDLEKLHQDVVKFSQCIMNAVFRLFTSSSGISIHKEKGRGRGRAMVLINTCIMKFHFKATSVEDLYGIYLKQQSVKEEEGQSESIELLTQDEHLFSNALSMLADIVEQDDSSWNDVEQHVIPLMSFLHTISPKGLVAHVLSVESKGEVGMVVQSIQKLVTSLPNMHSYPWMELTLAFIYKLRFHLLSSIDHVSMKEQEDRIRATRDIYDSLPSTFLEGIESLDPPLSNAILKRLSDEKRCFDYKFTHFHERTFLEWSREYIVDFVCCHSKYLATFTCSGIYAPLSDDYGTEIATVPWIDVNKNDITFFTSPRTGKSIAEDACFGEMFAKRKYVSISFDDLGNVAVLNDGECALMFPISTEESKRTRTGIESLLPKTGVDSSSVVSSSSDKDAIDLNVDLLVPNQEPDKNPSRIEIIVKKSEYAGMKVVLQNRSANVRVENESDEGSNSTVASIKSRISTRNNAKVARNHIELSTKFGHQFPERLLDAEDFIVNELTKRGVGSPTRSAASDVKHELRDTPSVETTERSITEYASDEKSTSDRSNDLTTPAHKGGPFPQQTERERDEEAPQVARRLSVAEITPLQSTNTCPTKARIPADDRDGALGAFDTLSSVLGVVDVSEILHANESVETFLKDRRVQDLAEAVRSFDDALSKAGLQMNALVNAQKRLANLTDVIDTHFVSDAASLVRSGENNRRQFRQKNEMKLLSDCFSRYT